MSGCASQTRARRRCSGTATFAEIIQMQDDVTRNDDDDGDGDGCQPPERHGSGSASTDGTATSPTSTSMALRQPDNTWLHTRRRRRVAGRPRASKCRSFDHKLLQHPVLDFTVTVLDDTGRVDLHERRGHRKLILLGCTSKGVPNPGAGTPVPLPTPSRRLRERHARGPSVKNHRCSSPPSARNPILQRIRPTKDNGVRADLLDENCEAADAFGSPYNAFVEPVGSTQSPNGGLTVDCRDATLTIRMFEGDIDRIAMSMWSTTRWPRSATARRSASWRTTRFFDLEPNTTPADFDIDVKDPPVRVRPQRQHMRSTDTVAGAPAGGPDP